MRSPSPRKKNLVNKKLLFQYLNILANEEKNFHGSLKYKIVFRDDCNFFKKKNRNARPQAEQKLRKKKLEHN